MSAKQFVLPIVDLYDGKKRRELIEYFLEQPKGEWFPKGDIVDAIDASHGTIRSHLGPIDQRTEPLNGPLVQYGVADVRDPTANHPHYRRGETDVVRALLSWRNESDGYPLSELLGKEARRKLVAFFLEQADPDEEYNRTEITNELDSNYSTIDDNIGVLVDAGVVEEIGDGYGMGYRLDTDSDIVAFLRTLNALLMETYRERSD